MIDNAYIFCFKRLCIYNLKSIVIILFLTNNLVSQITRNPVTISTFVDSPVRAGEVVHLKINAEMDKEWHIYSIYEITEGPLPTEISVSGQPIGSVAPVIEPKPEHLYDPGFETDTYYHSGDTQFILPIRIKRTLNPGKYSIFLEVFYMVCNERLC